MPAPPSAVPQAEQHDLSAEAGSEAVVQRMRALLQVYNASAVSSAQQGMADDPRGSPPTRTDGHNGTVFPWG